MKIGVLGTGAVGTKIGTKLVQLGHDVMMGSGTKTNAKSGGVGQSQRPEGLPGHVC